MRPYSLSLAIAFTQARGRSSALPQTPSTSNAVTPGGELLVAVRPGPRRFNPHAARDLTTRLFSSLDSTPSEYRSQLPWRPDMAAVRP